LSGELNLPVGPELPGVISRCWHNKCTSCEHMLPGKSATLELIWFLMSTLVDAVHSCPAMACQV
jgi:hypothetical protein